MYSVVAIICYMIWIEPKTIDEYLIE